MKMHVFTKKYAEYFVNSKRVPTFATAKRKHSPKASQAKARQNQGSARSSIG